MLNGFPARYSRPHSYRTQDKDVEPPRPTFIGFTALSYIKAVSDKIKLVLTEIGIKVVFKPLITIG